MEKSPEAFRTISEVADWLGVPTHVLRFWESRFSQVKPVKRAGGRRYYRPSDMLLLGGIKRLLHDDGMTIRGVQKLLREEGVKHVASFSQSLDTGGPMRDVTPAEEAAPSPMAVDVEPEPVDNVVPMAQAASAEGESPQAGNAMDAGPEELAPVAEDLDSAPDDVPEVVEEADTGPVETPEIAAEAPQTGPAEPEYAPEDDRASPLVEEEPVPELSFLRRPAPEAAEADAGEAAPPREDTQTQADLFTSRRSAAAAPPPPEHAPKGTPEAPDVPDTDPEDDDPAFPARPGLAAWFRGVPPSRLEADPALVAHAVSELRAIRARL